MIDPEILISENDIAARVDELAAQISSDYADHGELVLVGVLKGAFIFLADLSRRLTIPRHIEARLSPSPATNMEACQAAPCAWSWTCAQVSKDGTC